MKSENDAALLGDRMYSLDQFRGYTVAGMYLVNFLGGYAAVFATLDHFNTHISYADTIMPQFFFAVGFAYRLTFMRTLEKEGIQTALRHALRRNAKLFMVGLLVHVFYHAIMSLNEIPKMGFAHYLYQLFIHNMFQTLVHIALTSLWILPVIAARPFVRVLFMAASGLIYLLLSYSFYYAWVLNNGIDGGPLGFMSWTIPMLVGTLAYDIHKAFGARKSLAPLLYCALLLMLLGYAISCINTINYAFLNQVPGGIVKHLNEPPFFPPSRPLDIWSMSQKAGAVSYMTFAAGFSLLVYALFVLLSDLGTLRLGVFRTLGQNALLAYILGGLISLPFEELLLNESPLARLIPVFGIYFLAIYAVMRLLEYKKIFLKL